MTPMAPYITGGTTAIPCELTRAPLLEVTITAALRLKLGSNACPKGSRSAHSVAVLNLDRPGRTLGLIVWPSGATLDPHCLILGVKIAGVTGLASGASAVEPKSKPDADDAAVRFSLLELDPHLTNGC